MRKTWPKIRRVSVKGKRFYQVDARRKGTNGKRETFSVKKEAEARVAEIAQDLSLKTAMGIYHEAHKDRKKRAG